MKVVKLKDQLCLNGEIAKQNFLQCLVTTGEFTLKVMEVGKKNSVIFELVKDKSGSYGILKTENNAKEVGEFLQGKLKNDTELLEAFYQALKTTSLDFTPFLFKDSVLAIGTETCLSMLGKIEKYAAKYRMDETPPSFSK